jgi:excisionase family DNA binding protein
MSGPKGRRGPKKGAPNAGRPRISPEVKSALVEAIRGGKSVQEAAEALGIGRSTARAIARAAGLPREKDGRKRRMNVDKCES